MLLKTYVLKKKKRKQLHEIYAINRKLWVETDKVYGSFEKVQQIMILEFQYNVTFLKL